jgi:integrase/recombinase XerD
MTKSPVTASPLLHRGVRRIKVECPFDEAIISQIKKLEGRQWSKTHHCWHVPYTPEAFRQLKEMFEVSIPPAFIAKKQAPAPAKSTIDSTPTTIRLEKESDHRFKAFVPWQRKDWIEKIKTIPGRAWNEQEKYWSLPLTKSVIACMNNWFGGQLQYNFKVQENLPSEYVPKRWKPAIPTPKKQITSFNSVPETPNPVKHEIQKTGITAPAFGMVSIRLLRP